MASCGGGAKSFWRRHSLDSKHRNEPQHSDSGSSWKFWRRLSSRRHDHKNALRKEKPEIVLLEKGECDTEIDDVFQQPPQYNTLPDVVENPSRLPRFNSNAVPPPKPPRLFLIRTPSTNSGRLRENRDDHQESTYMNCERVTELQAQIQALSADPSSRIDRSGKNTTETSTTGENNNEVHKLPYADQDSPRCNLYIKNNLSSETPAAVAHNAVAAAATTPSQCTVSPAYAAVEQSVTSNLASSQPQQREVSAQRPKIVTPELRTKRPGRLRRRSNEKGEVTRQRHIMNNVGELLRQRLDPYPLLGRLKQAGLLNEALVQMYMSTRDRRSVCEGLVDLMGEGEPELIPTFCDVLSSTGASTEILEILQVMREMDHIIHDVTCNNPGESSVMEEEKNVTFDVGYLAPDLSLKPLVELERVRASGDKRLSKTSSRNSAYSLLEGGDSDSRNGEQGLFPGLVMMSVCVTGHDLSGQRAEALAQMIKSHNCVSQLHLGKTQLCGEDVSVIAKALQENRTVHSLDLRLNTVDQIGAESLAELLHKTKSLRNLNLSSSGLDKTGIQTIMAAVSANRTLVDLDLSFLEISDESCCHLRDMLRSSSTLQKLRLRNNNITASGCYALSEGLARNRSLTVLDLSRNTIGNEGMQALVKFLPESGCSELCVENCGLTSGSCDSLADLITHAKRLRTLDLSTNLLLDAGMCKLAPALERTSSLQSLSVNMCGVTNDGFSKLLDVLEKNTSIVHMKLCYNRLGRDHTNPAATSDNLRYRLRIVTSSKPKLKILLWGNAFDAS